MSSRKDSACASLRKFPFFKILGRLQVDRELPAKVIFTVIACLLQIYSNQSQLVVPEAYVV